jgi:hypothetical protein
MIKHQGLIYSHIVPRLRHLEFTVNLFDRSEGSMCIHLILYHSKVLHEGLKNLYWTLYDRHSEWLDKDLEEGNDSMAGRHGKDWIIKLKSSGRTSPNTMKLALRPLLKTIIIDMVEEDEIQVRLEGKFPKGWKSVFQRFLHLDSFKTERILPDPGRSLPGEKYLDKFLAEVEEEDIFWNFYDWEPVF